MLKRFILLISLLMSGPVFATCTGIACTCIVASLGLAFNTFSPIAGTPLDTTGTVTVTCSSISLSSNVAYQINLSTGNGGSFSPRQMASGGNHINYNLYTDSGRSLIWGDGTSGTSTVSDSYTANIITARINNYTVYGRILSSTSAGAGSYSDSITTTVIF